MNPQGDSNFYFVADDPDVAAPQVIELVETVSPSASALIPFAPFRCYAR